LCPFTNLQYTGFLRWHTFGHKLLLHGHDFRIVGLFDDFAQLAFDLFEGISGVEMLDDVL